MKRVTGKYRRRIAAVGPETAKLRSRAAELMQEGLEEATENQLYKRTPLPVTRRMYQSITTRIKGSTVQVGYDGRKARHAKYRLKKRGISKTGGHLMDMQPGDHLKRVTDPKIKRAARASKRRILSK